MKTLLTGATTPRRFVVLVTLGVAILQALWIAVVPPFRASDEFDHAFRAAAVADGHWRVTQETVDGRGQLVRAPVDIVAAAHEQCEFLDYTGTDNCNPVADAGDGHVWVGSGAGLYHPAFYWVIGTAAQPFEGAEALYAMRIAGSLLCLLFLGLAAWALSRGGTPQWAAAGFLLALTPVLLFSTAMAAPNGLEMATAVALWCALLVAPRAPDRRTQLGLLSMAVAAAMVLSTLRLLGPLFVLAIALSVVAYHRHDAFRLLRRHRTLVVVGSVVVGATVAAAAAWSISGDMVDGDGVQGGTDWRLNTLVLWPLQSIAAFPYRNTPAPVVVYVVVVVAVVALVWAALKRGPRAERLVVAGTLLAALILPVIVTALTKDERGVIWQGRYGLPLGVGFVLLAGLHLQRHVPPLQLSWRLVALIATVFAAIWSVCMISVVRRELEHPVSAADPTWQAPPAWAVLALCGLAWGCFARAVGRTRRDAA